MAETTPVPLGTAAYLLGSGSRDASATPGVSPQRHEVSEHPVRKMSRLEKERFSVMSSNAVKKKKKDLNPLTVQRGLILDRWMNREVVGCLIKEYLFKMQL